MVEKVFETGMARLDFLDVCTTDLIFLAPPPVFSAYWWITEMQFKPLLITIFQVFKGKGYQR